MRRLLNEPGHTFDQFHGWLSDRGITIWLDCPFAIVERRAAETAHRPLSLDAARFLQDKEEYWPFEGDDWPDEFVGGEAK